MRRSITIEPRLDELLNFVRGFFLLAGQDYNYTEVVNGAIFYGISYWLNIPKERAIELASKILTTELKIEGLKDEALSKLKEGLTKNAPD